ncbi:MAG: hypothetical protein VW397_07205 [Candidatus Margulisiibacteriota bacterium]
MRITLPCKQLKTLRVLCNLNANQAIGSTASRTEKDTDKGYMMKYPKEIGTSFNFLVTHKTASKVINKVYEDDIKQLEKLLDKFKANSLKIK